MYRTCGHASISKCNTYMHVHRYWVVCVEVISSPLLATQSQGMYIHMHVYKVLHVYSYYRYHMPIVVCAYIYNIFEFISFSQAQDASVCGPSSAVVL